VIRRGFWLVTGAVLGVTGYRKATQLARTLTGAQPLTPARPLTGTRPLTAARPLTGARPQRPLRSASSGSSAVTRVASAAVFIRDMRAGMAEYWDLHRGEQDRRGELDRGSGGRSLGSQSDRSGHPPDARAGRSAGTAPGASELARREP
jgi:hypothetical protein